MHLLPDVYESKIKHRNLHYAWDSIPIILEFFSKAQNMDIRMAVNMSHPVAAVYQSLHTCLSRRFSGKPSPRFSGWYCHSSFTHSDYFNYFLLIRICTKAIFWLYAHLCINDSIGTLASDFYQY
jgi:hypothetical protein